MGYLFAQDYKALIQVDSLSQIIGQDTSLLTKAEQAAQAEITSYLIQKYELAKEFTDTVVWAHATSYKAKNRVYLDATSYSASATYALNSLCLYLGNVYMCSTAVTVAEAFNAAKWALLGAQYSIFYVTNPEADWDYYAEYAVGDKVWFGDKVYTAVASNIALKPSLTPSVWGSGTAYSVAAGTAPTDTSKWTAGDNRNQQLVNYLVDVVLYHLHSRIAPRNIPELRVKRYDDVLWWLKNAAKGDSITAAIETKQPNQGRRIRWGSKIPKQDNSF